MQTPGSDNLDQASELLNFWFSEPMSKHWFKSAPEIDDEIRRRYQHLWHQASQRQLDSWMLSADACLALVILLDQLPLNMFRNQVESFATETLAIETVLYGLEQGYDKQLEKSRLSFFYMPLMHSESLALQEKSVALYEQAGLESNLRFARHHRDLIREFGRFPHRNAILGRQSTKAESAYLQSDRAFKG